MTTRSANLRANPNYHVPVLLPQTLDLLITDPNGIYIDGTLGGGGHTRAILERLGPGARLFGIDQDEEALAQVQDLHDDRFTPIRGNFGYMDVLLPADVRGSVSGILLDLGVSSHQIDYGARGFSFQSDGPLDMRMGKALLTTAADILNTYTSEALASIFYRYGEERHSRSIARAVENARPLKTTNDLKKAVESVIKGPQTVKSLARIFQAVRIEVNHELDMLIQALRSSLALLRMGGRLVVIAYHSLEDRLVKHFMRSGNVEDHLEKDFYGNPICPFRAITRNAIVADAHELQQNPRARSARLRAAERLAMEVSI